MLSALAHYTLANQEKRQSATLAWINPFDKPQHLRAQHEFDCYWKGAHETAERMGFALEEFTTQDLSLKRMDQIFKTRNIQGLILASLASPNLSKDWKTFPWQDYITVRFGHSTSYPPVHHIASAQTRNSLKAFQEIRKRGYQRIGFFGHSSPSRFFSAGFAFAQFYESENLRIPPFLYGKMNTEYLYINSLKKWLQRYTPDAIYTDSPHLPRLLNELGARIPADIGLATTSIHDTPIDAGINQNPQEIGRAAVRTLVGLLNEQLFGIPDFQNEILIEGQWIEGSMLPENNRDQPIMKTTLLPLFTQI